MWISITKVSIGEHKFYLHPADKLNIGQIYVIVWSERHFNGEMIISDIFISQIFKLEKQSMNLLIEKTNIYTRNSYRRIYRVPEMLTTFMWKLRNIIWLKYGEYQFTIVNRIMLRYIYMHIYAYTCIYFLKYLVTLLPSPLPFSETILIQTSDFMSLIPPCL